MTVKELKQELDNRGVEYDAKAKKDELEALLNTGTETTGKSYGVAPDDFPEVK